MDNPTLVSAVAKLNTFGEKAGFSTEEMIRILNCGFSVEELLDLIQYRLEKLKSTSDSAGLD